MKPIATQLSEPMNTFENNNNSILSSGYDKIEKYKSLLENITPFTRSSVRLEKRAAYNFNILLKSAINKNNNAILAYLNDAIEHLIEHFNDELIDLLEKKVDWSSGANVHFDLINDLSIVITQTLFHKQNLEEFREFCLQI